MSYEDSQSSPLKVEPNDDDDDGEALMEMTIKKKR